MVEVLEQPMALEVAQQGRRRGEAHVADDPQADPPLRQGGQRVGRAVEQPQLGALALTGEGLQIRGRSPATAGEPANRAPPSRRSNGPRRPR